MVKLRSLVLAVPTEILALASPNRSRDFPSLLAQVVDEAAVLSVPAESFDTPSSLVDWQRGPRPGDFPFNTSALLEDGGGEM